MRMVTVAVVVVMVAMMTSDGQQKHQLLLLTQILPVLALPRSGQAQGSGPGSVSPTWPLVELDLRISGDLSSSDRLAMDSIALLDQIGWEPLQMGGSGHEPIPEGSEV